MPNSRTKMAGSEPDTVPLYTDELTFIERQKSRLKEMEKRMEEEVKRKKKDWEKEVERMKEEFLHLYPADKKWGSEELLNDPWIARRRGSTDVLDTKKMKTLFLEYPDKGRRFKIRFNICGFKPDSVKVVVDGDRLIVKAIKEEENDKGHLIEKEYIRKISRPSEVDLHKLKSHLTTDGILILEAPLPPHSLNIRKLSGSPSHSSTQSTLSSRSRSPSNSPRTPSAVPKIGVPVFAGTNGERRMHLLLDVGKYFKPKDICVQVIKENRIMIKAKHEERTSERFSKNKYSKEYELTEKIETYSVRAGLMEDGKLLIGAMAKNAESGKNKSQSVETISKDINSQATPCNVLDLATFPPAAAPTTPT